MQNSRRPQVPPHHTVQPNPVSGANPTKRGDDALGTPGISQQSRAQENGNPLPNGLSAANFSGLSIHPLIITSASGCRFKDTTGKDYIDFTSGEGSAILGFGGTRFYQPCTGLQNPDGALRGEVKSDTPKAASRAGGSPSDAFEAGCLDRLPEPSSLTITLAQKLTETIQGTTWTAITHDGTSAVEAAVALARQETGKRLILLPRDSRQTAYPFCLSGQRTFPLNLLGPDQIQTLVYGDEPALEELFRRHRGKIAAVLLPPYLEPASDHAVMPHGTWYTRVESLCRQEGALFILDDLDTTLRLSLHGSHAYFGAHPDLICLGSTLANGLPMGVLLGTKALESAGSRIPREFFHPVNTASISAALGTLETLGSQNHMEILQLRGQSLRRGLHEIAGEAGLSLSITGPPAVPSIRIAGDPQGLLNPSLSRHCISQGVYLAPHRGTFLSLAHNEADLELAMERLGPAFANFARENSLS
ncbi:aminotransferase class III-fold pyridoxal phosphate-dependent enzyme [Spirochaeta lutea]|uniref:Aminotransferase class III n=1 Tax=Spirochaeta lutea TaxID=1480694 RepID=A0A098QYW0_9SPIO|nr:aminotransferase class III-fold pyridoxal phosphate-dependent enzyme [Spirochaeta lutea]KGE72814.1 hypothetical protein DC28_05400 [Spirochaeta lutea]